MIDLIKAGSKKDYEVSSYLKYNRPSAHAETLSEESASIFEPTVQSDKDYIAYNNEGEAKEKRSVEQDILDKMLKLEEEDLKRLKKNANLEDTTLEEMYKSMGQPSRSSEYTVAGYNQKIDRLKEHTDSMYTYALGKTGTLTINDLYKGSFTGSTGKVQGAYSKEDIKSILNMNSIEVTEGNTWAANKLLSIGADVSSDAVLKVQNIYTAIEELEHYEIGQEELEETLEKKIEDKVLVEGEGRPYEEDSIDKLKEDLGKVDDEIIKEVVSKGEEISINNLREAMLKNTQKITGNHKKEQIDIEAESIESTKKQINEIRARLNTQTAQRLSESMPLESSELSKVAEGLRKIDLEINEDALAKAQLEPTKEHVDTLQKVIEAAKVMGQYKELATKVQVESKGEATLENFHEILGHYEENATVAEARFGENISKVEDQVEEFLITKGIQVDELTIKSAKALILNQMDVSLENLEAAKGAVSKIETFLDMMNPYEAAKLIKEGLNPYKASINEIIETIQQGELTQIKGTIGEAIVSLENKKQITEEQKQSLIGLYRILNGVASSKEQVAGYLFKNELPLTLEKLEEAVKYAGKKENVHTVIDEAFGFLEEAKYETQTARKLIETSSVELKKLLQTVGMIESMPLEPTMQGVDEFTALKSMIYPFIKATIKKETGKFEGLDTLPKSLLDKIESVKNTSHEVLKTMKEHDIPLTLSNVYWIDKLSKEPNLYEELLRDTDMYKKLEDKGFPEGKEELEDILREIKEESQSEKELCMDKGDLAGYKNYKQLEEMSKVQSQLQDKEGLYQIPFMIEGRTKMIQLYIKEESKKKDIHKEGITAVMSYDTRTLGKVTTYFTVKGEDIHYKIHTENKASEEVLQQTKDKLKEMMSAIGYNIAKGSYEHIEEKSKPLTSMILRGESEFETII